MRMLSYLSLALVLASVTEASAEVIWRGDFETGTTEQWKGAAEVRRRQGRDRARARRQIRLADRRDQRRPKRQATTASSSSTNPNRPERPRARNAISAGASIVPKKLTDGYHSVGYFETRNSWTPVDGVRGPGRGHQVHHARAVRAHWTGKGKLTPGRWHDFAVHVLWSRDPEKGFVEVWFDGEKVVPQTKTATLRDENVAFFQIGFFRDTSDVPETIVIDHVVEATTLEEVTPPEKHRNADAREPHPRCRSVSVPVPELNLSTSMPSRWSMLT